ncbi:hypothetical protein BkAM31D_14890 [Halalkalibacter krulwichiae]|uniref:YlqD protein n=2 Tax=Halalkalibacter krulwichiae TaxID=199441 RepID=A0A1X9MC40_9BACI|nr:YlqD family protein [Halalkalibacter krulwichiae]ARK31025.1 hypothetical protein BkAM31D_14890 [Halalkalibacter krulwichiae]
MRVIRNVNVKHVVTKKKKAQIIQQFQGELVQSKREVDQLTFQLHKALRDANESSHLKIKEKYEQELTQRKERVKLLHFKLEQVEKLEIGTEIQEEQVKSIIDIHVGDRWSEQPAEIVIKDGIVQEIREGRYNG